MARKPISHEQLRMMVKAIYLPKGARTTFDVAQDPYCCGIVNAGSFMTQLGWKTGDVDLDKPGKSLEAAFVNAWSEIESSAFEYSDDATDGGYYDDDDEWVESDDRCGDPLGQITMTDAITWQLHRRYDGYDWDVFLEGWEKGEYNKDNPFITQQHIQGANLFCTWLFAWWCEATGRAKVVWGPVTYNPNSGNMVQSFSLVIVEEQHPDMLYFGGTE